MTETCLHLNASSVGYTEAPIERPDPSVAGMILFAGVSICPDCGNLVAAVSLHPKTGGAPILRTIAPVVLVPPRGGGSAP